MSGGLKPSFAFGGLSTVWGASVLPYRQANREISLINKAFKQCGLRVTTMLGRIGKKEMPLGENLDQQFETINNLLPQWGYEGGYVNIVAMREG